MSNKMDVMAVLAMVGIIVLSFLSTVGIFHIAGVWPQDILGVLGFLFVFLLVSVWGLAIMGAFFILGHQRDDPLPRLRQEKQQGDRGYGSRVVPMTKEQEVEVAQRTREAMATAMKWEAAQLQKGEEPSPWATAKKEWRA